MTDNTKALAPWEEGEVPEIFSSLSDPIDTLNLIGDAQPIEDMLGKPIDLVHIVVHKATVTAEDGTVLDVQRTILVDKKGAAFAAVSTGVLASLRLILGAMDRVPPFDPPLKIQVEQKNTRRGRRVYKIRVVK
jgi:hypothetical protein